MHTLDIDVQRAVNSRFLQRKIVKSIIPVLVLAYAGFELTAQQWLILGLLTAMIMMLVSRINSIKSFEVSHPKHVTGVTICTDGGSFSHRYQPAKKVKGRAIVHDGGSFERSQLK